MTGIGEGVAAPRRQAWRRLAAWRGGTVPALLLSDEGRTLLAATSAGVFCRRPEDSWQRLDDVVPMPGATCLASPPDAPGELWVGGEAGLFRSTDSGRSWVQALSGARVLSLAALTGGAVVAGTLDEGVVRSDDGGRTWHPANGGLLDLAVDAIVGIPEGHRLVAGSEEGPCRSYNGGRSWQVVDDVPEAGAVTCLVAVDGQVVLAGTEGGLLRSENRGDSWRAVEGLPEGGVSAIAVSGDLAVVAMGRDLHVSPDRGHSWRPGPLAPEPVISVALDDSGRLFAGLINHGVVAATADGVEWVPLSVGLAGVLITSLAVADDDHGQATVVATSAGGASIRAAVDGSALVQALPVANARRVVAAPGAGRVWAYGADGLYGSDDAGQSWEEVPAPAPVEALAVVAPGEGPPRIVVAVAGEVRASRDGGATWDRIATVPPAGRVLDLVALETGPVFLLIEDVSGGGREVWEVGRVAHRCLGAPRFGPVSMAAFSLSEAGDGCLVATADAIHHLVLGSGAPAAARLVAPPGTISALVTLSGADRFLVATDQGLFLTADGGASYAAQAGPDDRAPVLCMACAPGHPDTVYVACVGGNLWTRSLSG
ncbi:MAG: hypothetical protein WAM30_20315 [Candidatus Dormiibacterota bacterium]